MRQGMMPLCGRGGMSRPWRLGGRIIGECGGRCEQAPKTRTRFDSLISRRHWHKFYVDIRKERMATSSRRELDGFLTSATHSKRCTGQGIEVDSTPFGAFACGTSQGRRTGEPDQTVDGPFAELDGSLRRAITARHGLSSRMVRESWAGI